MILKELKCKGCGSPLKAKERDILLSCSSCGKVSMFSNGSISDVEFGVAKPKEGVGELVYVPFWIVHAELEVKHEKISGGGIWRAIEGKKQMRGTRNFYVCSGNIPEEYSRKWNMDLTLDQPEITEITSFRDGRKLVTVMEQDVACENAEFLFLRYETEIPGTLQELDYTFHILDSRILYIPVWKDGDAYTLGI